MVGYPTMWKQMACCIHHNQVFTEAALLAATEMLRASLNSGGSSAIILLHPSAAFDTVSHKILLERLHEYWTTSLIVR